MDTNCKEIPSESAIINENIELKGNDIKKRKTNFIRLYTKACNRIHNEGKCKECNLIPLLSEWEYYCFESHTTKNYKATNIMCKKCKIMIELTVDDFWLA